MHKAAIAVIPIEGPDSWSTQLSCETDEIQTSTHVGVERASFTHYHFCPGNQLQPGGLLPISETRKVEYIKMILSPDDSESFWRIKE